MKLMEVWNLRKEGAVWRRKASFGTGSSYWEEVMLWQESSRDEFHGQCEAEQSSAQKQFWPKEEFAKQENKPSKHVRHCSGIMTPRSGRAGQCSERGYFLRLLGKGKTNQPTPKPPKRIIFKFRPLGCKCNAYVYKSKDAKKISKNLA